jgi:hypothetical protein
MEVNYERYYEVIAKRIMKAIKSSARKPEEKGQFYGRTEAIPIDITFEQILDRVKQINGKCERTGINFPLVKTETDYCMSSARKLGFNPLLAPSADRVDPNGMYTMSNLQIVIQWYNMGKGAKSQTEANELMEFLRNPPNEQRIYNTITKETIDETKTNNKNLKQNNMKSATAEIELIKALIDNDASEHALKFYMQTKFNNKVEFSINKVSDNSKEKKVGKPYIERETYLDNNTTEIDELGENHSLLIKVLNVKDKHAMLSSNKFNKVMKHNIKLVKAKASRGAGFKYGIDKNDISKLQF